MRPGAQVPGCFRQLLDQFEVLIADDEVRLLSAATLVEAAIVLETRFGDGGGRELDLWLVKVGIEVVAVDADQAEVARRVWRRFGKERHAAGLNFGDCFAYALAITRGERLLFKGDDFSKTDVTSALPRAL